MYIHTEFDVFKYIDDGLNYGEIYLLSLITSYYESSREFYPSNEYLSNLFHTSERNIQKWLKKLKDHKLICFEYEDGKRFILPSTYKSS